MPFKIIKGRSPFIPLSVRSCRFLGLWGRSAQTPLIAVTKGYQVVGNMNDSGNKDQRRKSVPVLGQKRTLGAPSGLGGRTLLTMFLRVA